MSVKHVMKDGAELDDIRGKVVKQAEARAVYEMIRRKKWHVALEKSKSTVRH